MQLSSYDIWQWEEDTAQHNPSYQQCQNQVEGLTNYVQCQRFTTLHVVCHFLEVGFQTDGCEGQAEAPAFIVAERFQDCAVSFTAEGWHDDEREDYRSNKETNDEFRGTGAKFRWRQLYHENHLHQLSWQRKWRLPER